MSIPVNTVGLPKSVNYDLPPSLSDSAKSMFVSVAPNGITETPTVSLPTTSFTANSGSNFGSFGQSLIAFDIPCGGGFASYLDPHQTTISFRLVYTLTTASTGGSAASINIISSAASFIDQLVLYSSNTPLETINNYGVLHNLLLNSTCNYSQRTTNGFMMGADTNSMTGIELPITGLATYYFNFSLPLVSIIGVSSLEKLFPVGLINNLQLQLLTAQYMPLASYCTAVTTQPVGTLKLDQWSLNLKYIDLGEMAGKMLEQNIAGGKLYLKSSTWVNSNATVSNGSSGSTSLLLQIRNSSVKSLFTLFGTNGSYAICPNQFYDSICPDLTSAQYSCPSLGFRAPNKPLNPMQRPAETFNHYMMAFGAGAASTYGGVIGREPYCSVLTTVPTQSDASWQIPASGLRPLYTGDDFASTQVSKFPNSFVLGVDCERVSGSLFSGINTRASPPQLDITVGTATTVSLLATSFGLIDVVAEVDVYAKSVIVYN